MCQRAASKRPCPMRRLDRSENAFSEFELHVTLKGMGSHFSCLLRCHVSRAVGCLASYTHLPEFFLTVADSLSNFSSIPPRRYQIHQNLNRSDNRDHPASARPTVRSVDRLSIFRSGLFHQCHCCQGSLCTRDVRCVNRQLWRRIRPSLDVF